MAKRHLHGSSIRLLEPLAAHFIGIPSVIAHELEDFVRDAQGDAGDEIEGALPVVLKLKGVYPVTWNINIQTDLLNSNQR